jgi:enoyl-CoA hydratase
MSSNISSMRKTSQKAVAEETSAAQNDGPQTIIVDRRDRIGLITLNRPKSLNALNRQLAAEVLTALQDLDRDDRVSAIVITGSPRAFAAGVDIEEMAESSFTQFYMDDFLAPWDEVRSIRKPLIAAVGGFALGGGCELALLCDFIIAAEDAQFGQPEIKLGILPGMGGSQLLARAIGKALTMDLVLTGRTIGAQEAKAVGLVARVVPPGELLQTALEAAHTIAGYNAPATRMAKEAVNRAFESTLSEGLRYERLLFQSAFATEGQKEGMNAFVNKRAPVFRDR